MIDFTILVLEESYASGVAVTLDILAAASALAVRVAAPVPTWQLCSIEGGSVRLQGGMSVDTLKLKEVGSGDTSTWVIPGLGMVTHAAITQRVECADAVRVIERLARHVEAGGSVAASCSAVFLLQAAGLLRGRRATSTWWLAPLLKKLEPRCAVDANRMVCADGLVVTAGAAFAQTDLMLHLLRERFGGALTDSVSRMLLIDGRQAQAPFIVPEVLANGNELVARIAARIESALPHSPSIAELAQEFCMSERTLSRRIHSATGKSTLALVQSVKLRRAKNLLETTRMTVDQVAEAVGYQDSTALRRLMKKVIGANPGRCRPESNLN